MKKKTTTDGLKTESISLIDQAIAEVKRDLREGKYVRESAKKHVKRLPRD